MASRSSNTILLITRDRLARADFDKSGVLGELHEQPAPTMDDFPSLVEAALRLSATRPARVWVLTTEVWTQTLSLPEETVAGLGPEDLGRAVAFEAEPLSGVSAADSVVGWVEQGRAEGQRRLWLVQIPMALPDQVEYIVRQAGGRLMGLTHPAGLPRPLITLADKRVVWQRIELWPGAMVVARGEAGQVTTLVVNSDPKPGRWEADLQRWLPQQQAAVHQESLHASASVATSELDPVARLSLDESESLGEFLTAWAGELSARSPAVPLARPTKRPLAAGSQGALAVGAALIALALCSGHFMWLKHRMAVRQAEIVRLRGPIEAFNQAKKEVEGLLKKRDELGAGYGKLEGNLGECRKVLAAQQNRLRALLVTLAESGLEEVTIEKIESSGDELVLHGTCLEAGMADQLAAILAPKMDPLGWRVQLPSKRAQELFTDHGPWQFQLRIIDAEAVAKPATGSATVAAGTKQEID
jgi:hypothetical protein